jgi:mRNA (2'-O-methyladenosine-N6-)-methyltransferase
MGGIEWLEFGGQFFINSINCENNSNLENSKNLIISISSLTSSPPTLPSVVCLDITRDWCNRRDCPDTHFAIDARETTDSSLGLCSYMNLCLNSSCRFVHLDCYPPTPPLPRPFPPGDDSQWINCDVRSVDLSRFSGLVSTVLIDPPWDIHMALPYGTMTDDEMRTLPVHLTGADLVFVWCTSRTLEVARDCLRGWGYTRAEEIVWVKVNQVWGTTRSGRTGHWFNHNKEHCLVGLRPGAVIPRRMFDSDVIVAEVRETSRKPDELYELIDRLTAGDAKRRRLELFGRRHNIRPGWITLGNQLGDTRILDSELINRFD